MEERKEIVVDDEEVIAAREEFLKEIVETYRIPIFTERLEPVKIIEYRRWDYWDFLAEREREIGAARRILSGILDELVARSEEFGIRFAPK